MAITIVNIRNLNAKQNKGIIIRVDRTSVLGNPFYMHTEAERDKVCEDYEAYFYKKVTEKTDTDFMNELRRIYRLAKEHDVCLACWCAPKRCHAETIKKFIEKYL